MAGSTRIDIEPLRTILRIECRKNCVDRTVIGGLDEYLRRWAKETRDKIPSPSLATQFRNLQLAEPSYGDWDAEKRKAWIREVLDWLARAEAARNPMAVDARVDSAASVVPGASKRRVPAGNEALDSAVTAVKGVSSALSTRLERLGVKTVRDLLYFFPRRHLDYSQRKSVAELEVGKEQTAVVTVWEARVNRLGYQRGTEAIVGDETGNMRVVWFNQPYLAKRFKTNAQLVLSGKVTEFGRQKVFESPEWELIEDRELIHTGRLVPVYPLTRGLYPRQVRNVVKRALDDWLKEVTDFLPSETRERCRLLDLPVAIAQAHYPDNQLMKDEARKRLAFDELFLLQIGVLNRKRSWQESQPGKPFRLNGETISKLLDSLPFALTGAQQRVLQEIFSDLKQSKPMSRLLQGEVGSGKTVIAVAALLVAAANGYQAVLMAPTEILAGQHYRSVTQLLASMSHGKYEQGNQCKYAGILSRPVTMAQLVGSLSDKEKDALHRDVRGGQIDIVIGTHALIQKGVEFERLGLAVIDEQHRFGVLQRSALRQKGFNPHILVMTATPIPRTLALTLHGDLDLSVIDELPPGRQAIKTRWIEPTQRGRAYDFVRRQVAEGRQAFIICPLIEESESVEAKAAIAEYERLSQQVFTDLKLGLLHGRMPAGEKEAVMRGFSDGKVDILVSTPVVEVGIDVPNATVMLIEAANRFGLSQLHQFRGRVGRGDKQSYCLLLAETASAEARERLKAIEEIHDGFALAEKDLELRGPGDFLGTRQSGFPQLRMARLSDVAMLELARSEALAFCQDNPDLNTPQHSDLAREMGRVWQGGGEWS